MRTAELRTALRRLLRRTEEAATDNGLTAQRYDLLLQIAAGEDGESTVGELTERLQLGQTAVSEIVKRAIGAGLVDRRQSAKDGRVGLLCLTPEGERRFRATFDALEADRNAFLRAYRDLGKRVRAYTN